MPKMCFFKLHRGSESTLKEIEIGDIVRRDKELAKYIAQLESIGAKGFQQKGNIFITSTKFAPRDCSEDEVRAEMFKQCGVRDNVYSHRMYVLARMHSQLKDEADNPVFQENAPKFFDFEELKKVLGAEIEKYRELYETISQDPAHHAKRTISHNDAKEDNWFNKYVLGDFANASPGVEYKDIARSMLDQKDGFKHALDTESVSENIEDYIKIAAEINYELDDAKSVPERVFEIIFTESLRIAYFQKDRGQKQKIIDGYMTVAEKYFKELTC